MAGDDKRLITAMGCLIPLLLASYGAERIGIPFDLVYWSGALALTLYIIKGKPR